MALSMTATTEPPIERVSFRSDVLPRVEIDRGPYPYEVVGFGHPLRYSQHPRKISESLAATGRTQNLSTQIADAFPSELDLIKSRGGERLKNLPINWAVWELRELRLDRPHRALARNQSKLRRKPRETTHMCAVEKVGTSEEYPVVLEQACVYAADFVTSFRVDRQEDER